VKNMKAIMPSFRYGRQEDAHEFLRYVISGLQAKEIPKNKTNTDVSPSESDIFAIFGGYLRSEVHCYQCGKSSFTYDQFLDLSLEISNSTTLENCFKHFTDAEILEKRNAYSCQECQTLTKASKCFTIHTPPPILVVQLKRFALKTYYASLRWEKTRKKVRYPSVLDLGPFLASKDKNQGSCNYQLYGVLVHDGSDMNNGHYYSIVKASNRAWYKMNDGSVTQSSLQEALRQEAYVLFYSRQPEDTTDDEERTPNKIKHNTSKETTTTTTTTKTIPKTLDNSSASSVMPLKPYPLKEASLENRDGFLSRGNSIDPGATTMLISEIENGKKKKIGHG